MSRSDLLLHYFMTNKADISEVGSMCWICIFHCDFKCEAQRNVSASEGRHIRFKNQNKSQVPNILKTNESTGQFSNIKRSEKPKETTNVHNDRITFIVKENNLTTSNTLPKFTIKRCLHEGNYRGQIRHYKKTP